MYKIIKIEKKCDFMWLLSLVILENLYLELFKG